MAEPIEITRLRFRVSVAAILLLALAIAGRSLDMPGLYYDEAVQARPAKEFVTGAINATPFPGSTTISLAGRPFPVMTQPYMGALKSQALIPMVWLFGSDTSALRATTLLWAFAGIAVIAAFARRAFGESTALLAALLLASDPSLLLIARHDWGSFALSLLLRGIALYSAWRWWETGRRALPFEFGLAVGLGLYNKADVAVFLVAGSVGVLACGARPLIARLRAEPLALVIAALGFALGFAPMMKRLPSLLARRNTFATPGEGAEKLRTLVSMLDASYFGRLMEVGGFFGRMQEAQHASTGPLGLALIAALGIGLVLVFVGKWNVTESRAAGRFVLAAVVAGLLAYALLPGGVRIHHALNIYPFPHLLIAWVLGQLCARGRGARIATVPGATLFATPIAALLAALLATMQLAVFERTLDESIRNGGKGRWSDSLNQFARDLDARPAAVVVSMDWGFHESLGYLTDGPRLLDAYPRIPIAVARQGLWSINGGPQHVYLLHEAPYDLFGYSAPFLAALGQVDPEIVSVSKHNDREGDLAFLSVQLSKPRRVIFRPSSGFQFQLAD